MKWFCIRKARIPEQERNIFERYGVTVVSLILTSGFHPAPSATELNPIYDNSDTGKHARDWLTEQHKLQDRRETWTLAMEVAITLLVAFELILSILAAAGYEHPLRFLFRKG